MDNKYQQSNQQQAAGACAATCTKCHGNCVSKAEHNGAHQCNGSHSW